jgi:two-component system sensor kinase FixL
MVVLVLTALAPVALIGSIMVSDGVVQARRHFRALLAERSAAVALAFDREIEVISVALAVMSSSTGLRSGNAHSAFLAGAKAVAEAMGNELIVHNPATIGDGAAPGLRRALAERQGGLGSRADAADAGEAGATGDAGVPGVPVYRPVIQGDHVVAVLEMSLTEQQISTVLAAQNRGEDAMALVLDPSGRLVGGAGRGALDGGQTVPAWLAASPQAAPGPAPSLAHGIWPDGEDRLCASMAPERAPGWRVAVCAPASSYDASWQDQLAEHALTLAASLLLGIAAAIALSRRLVRPLAALTDHARAVARGEDRHVEIPRSPVAEFEALRVSVRDAETELRRRALAEHLAMLNSRTSQRLLDSVLNGAAEGIHVTDLEGRYVMMNQAARISLGLGLLPRDGIGLTPAGAMDRPAARQDMELDREVVATAEIRTAEGTRLVAGMARQFALTKTPWRDATGRIAGVVTVARDVTEARAADAHLRALQADLLRATRLSSMGAMASGLAHEINQPLAAATNFLNAALRLSDRAAAADPTALATTRAAVAEAAEETMRAARIVRRLRSFVERGEATLRPEPVSEVVAGACALARADGALSGLELVADCAPDTGEALLDRTQMQQVLLNLIRNAAEAIAARGVRPDDRIAVRSARDAAGTVTIAVSDTGPGLPSDILPRLFQPFVSTKHGGLGIGLAICRTIVEGHGGRLSLKPGTGETVFEIVLPARQRDTAIPGKAA